MFYWSIHSDLLCWPRVAVCMAVALCMWRPSPGHHEPSTLLVALHHTLCVLLRDTLQDCLEALAWVQRGRVNGTASGRHSAITRKCHGVSFPGACLLNNCLEASGSWVNLSMWKPNKPVIRLKPTGGMTSKTNKQKVATFPTGALTHLRWMADGRGSFQPVISTGERGIGQLGDNHHQYLRSTW